MSVIRAFIAVDLPPDLQEHLAQVVNALKEQLGDVPVRWVPAENMHLTLKFLGDVSLSNLDVLTDILRGETADREKMVVSLGGLGAFPTIKRPRVIWAGMEAPPDLEALQRNLDKQTARVGYGRENRPFSPHITLGRVSRNATPDEVRFIGDVLNNMSIGYLGVARISAVHLYRSDLQSNGAVYSHIFSAPLGD